MNRKFQRFLFPGLFSLIALGGCGDAGGADPAPVEGAEGGGKADDADAVCESPDCLEVFDFCMSGTVADPEECGAGLARCLAVNEGGSLQDCAALDSEEAGVCESCNDLPDCDVIEDGADTNNCLGAVAVCQFETLGRLPSGCALPESGDPCASRGCTDLYAECLVTGSVYDCRRSHAGCLASQASFELDACDIVPDSEFNAQQCDACLSTEACAAAEEGGDAQACEASKAECHWDAFGVLPGNCEPPEVELGDACLSVSCRTQLDACLESIDREGCTREYAGCLAVEESFELPTCDLLPDQAQETCRICDGVAECESVEDGADANACAAAMALCHWDTLAVLPGACTLPPALE